MQTAIVISVLLNIIFIATILALNKYCNYVKEINGVLRIESIQDETELKKLRASVEFEKSVSQDLIKKANELHRENSNLRQKMKWYAVRMDIKRKHK